MDTRLLLIVSLVLIGCASPAHAKKNIDYNLLSNHYTQPAKIPAMLCLEDMQAC